MRIGIKPRGISTCVRGYWAKMAGVSSSAVGRILSHMAMRISGGKLLNLWKRASGSTVDLSTASRVLANVKLLVPIFDRTLQGKRGPELIIRQAADIADVLSFSLFVFSISFVELN
jgi:hypothetical protein